jgi:polysaccharide pyruvyl transferase WcaK-like protein
LGPTLAAYDAVLQAGPVDFVGNRLHGGIRALQKGRRALILSLDNRAAEIARDTCLPVISLENGLTALDDWLRRPDPIEIVLPKPAIAAWREQFMR